ncbi:MAG: hypothetical protein KatS3mg064_2859 [Tepidiforma sp.]|nr:Vms1/Ankzf1 family peptidyl-tRNA hydrolase [Tepidiforma sp.]GIW19702.1 MAG: hypothetical protein KatS3mg064_2859 [Tepidiforma sp.]
MTNESIPNEQQLEEVLRRVARWDPPAGIGILSVYLDWRPQATGERPGLRSGEVVLKDRLREIEASLGVRGPALDSFRADAERVHTALAELDPAAEGAAIFACSAAGLFEVIPAPAPFDNQVVYDRYPRLYQLARLLDEFETAVVAVADTNTLRLFVVRGERIREVPGRDDDPYDYQMRSTSGMNEHRFRRHVEQHRREFAEEAAKLIEQLCEQERATRLVIAGDETALHLLREALPLSLTRRVEEGEFHIDIRAGLEHVRRTIEQFLLQTEDDLSHETADILAGEVEEGDLGVAGYDRTKYALELGAADVVVIDDAYEPAARKDELARLAAATGARVEVVREHHGLRALGGVGAILRYRLP